MLCGVLALLGACRRVPVETASAANADKPSLLFQGFGARASHLGTLVWEAHAVRARVFDADQRAVAEDVTIDYYINGKKVSTAHAKLARMNLRSYDLEAEGDVKVQSEQGVVLTTSRLSWDNQRQRASSTARVRVLRGGAVLTGRGFTADRDLHDLRILEDVQAEAVSVEQMRKEAATWPKP